MKRKQQNLILVGPSPPPYTGQSVSFGMLMEGMRERGIDFKVVDISRKSPGPGSTALVRARELLSAYAGLLGALRLGGNRLYITIAQSRQGFLRDLLYIWTAWLFGTGIVVHLKGGNYDGFYKSQPGFMQWLIRVTLNRCERVIVLGEGLRHMFNFLPDHARKTVVVNNGLPIAEHGSSKQLADGAEPVQVLYLSNLMETKGYLDILAAAASLQESGAINAQYTFAGEFIRSSDDSEILSVDERRRQFDERVVELGLVGKVRYIGSVSGADKWALLQQSHLFVLPTNYVNEGQPVSIIEAIAHGCVIVTTNFRAISDMIDENENGVYVEYGNPRSISEAITQVASSKETYRRMSEHSINLYERKFTRERHLDNLIHQIVS